MQRHPLAGDPNFEAGVNRGLDVARQVVEDYLKTRTFSDEMLTTTQHLEIIRDGIAEAIRLRTGGT